MTESASVEKVFAWIETQLKGIDCSIFKIGSLAHGGYSAQVSDIDVAVLFKTQDAEMAERVIFQINERLTSSQDTLMQRVSVFWSCLNGFSDPNAKKRFHAIDRLDLIQFGNLYSGEDIREDLREPKFSQILLDMGEFYLNDYINDRFFERIRGIDQLFAEKSRWCSKLVLFPVRFVYTIDHQKIASNDEAVEKFLLKYDVSLDLVRLAKNLRQQNSSVRPDEYTAERVLDLYDLFAKRFSEIAECGPFLKVRGLKEISCRVTEATQQIHAQL